MGLHTRKRKSSLLVIAVVIICSIVVLLPFWSIHLKLKGNVYYTQEDIFKMADLKEGMHLLEIMPSKRARKIEKLPYVKEAFLEYVFPNTLQITVTESLPIGYVPFSGTYLALNEQGQALMKNTSLAGEFKLPVIYGLRFQRFTIGEKILFENEDHFLAVAEVLKILSKYDYTEKVQSIDVSNLEEIHLYVDKLDVIIGSMKDFEKKMGYLMEIHKEYTSGILDLSEAQKGEAVLRPLH